jgi:hypothetical protein
MKRQEATARQLRAAIDRLPLATRRAMLDGIQTNPIVVGADGDPRGGVCPVYAISDPPSRRIGRPFARAWDRYAGAWLPRRASERELLTLRSMLETSIELETEPAVFLDAAIVAHKASQARSRAVTSVHETRPPARQPRRPAPRRDSGERDRTGELSRRRGWAWTRPVRRYDDYERALQALEEMEREAGSESEQERLVTSPSGRG